jgi:ATP-dependent helicase/nuclease subunit B
MSIRILYGPKKKALTEIFINEINESIKKNHKYRLIVVIPEQFSSYYEEQLASGKGFMKVEVMTFSRLMQRFFDLRYIDCDELINDTGKTMLLYSLLNKDDMRLEFYNKSKTYPGFSVLAKQTIDELRANNISYEDIRNISQKDNISESSRKKFFEISKIYEGYVTILKDSGLNDQTDLYDMLCEHIKNTSAFDNSIIWFDRFAFFSSKEFDVIKAFMKKAERINISLCMDYRMKRPDNDLFTIPQTTMDKIKKEAKTQNINIIEENDYSFMDARGNLKTLEVLFDNLFRSKYEKSNQVPDAIEVFKAYDIYEEVEYAAIRIMNAVKNRGLRFKDILCVASDVTSYERVIKAVFDQYDIPII